jgi:EmrB/QacA subfamily drug resistance transporter
MAGTVTEPVATHTPRGIGLRSERGPILGALMLCIALVALDSTIIATAVPSVVRNLGGFSQFPWLFSIYLLTQAVSTPLYGTFADVVGRKPVLLFGVGLFLFGSLLCGVAWSMPALIVSRGVQGLGAGAVLPISITVVGDLYSVEERARVQGYVASVWGIAAVVGPTLGGVFSQYASWRWIFLINLPLGAVATWMLMRSFKENVTRKPHRVDVAGALLLTTGCSLVILGLLEGGVAWDWHSAISALVFVLGAAALIAFVLVERRAAEPVVPLWVFRHRVLVSGNLTAVCIGAVMIGLSSYIPTYAQGVLRASALVAGFTLAALTVGWPLAASYSGKLYMRIGFRDTALIGSGVVVVAAILCAFLSGRSTLWEVAGVCFVMGVGLGLSNSPTIVAVQSVVGWKRRGVVTGTNLFSRSIGSAVGAAVFGAIANATLAHRFAHPPPELKGRLPSSVDATSLALNHTTSAASDVAVFVRSALADASHNVFAGLLVGALGAVTALLFMPRRTTALVFDED